MRSQLVALVACVAVAAGCGASTADSRGPEPTAAPATATTSASPTTGAPDCRGTGTESHKSLPYTERPGVDPNLLSLDLYEPVRPDSCAPAPVVVYVHGGGFQTGDKRNSIDEKVAAFNGRGWVFVSMNYRLFGKAASGPLDSGYPGQIEDLAAGLASLTENAGTYDLDPDQILLLGHSAGAFLVAEVATDEDVLAAAGVEPTQIRCVVPLDTEGYDVDANAGVPIVDHWDRVFPDRSVRDDASPIVSIQDGPQPPDFLVVTRGSPSRIAASQAFADSLGEAGAHASVLVATGYSHGGVNAAIGDPDDSVVSPRVMDLFEGCVG